MRLLVWSFLCVVLTAGAAPGVSGEGLPRHGVLGAVLSENAGVVTVTAVVPGSAAEKAQIQPGDIIRAIGASPVTTSSDVIQTVRRTRAGTTLRIEILRKALEKQVLATLSAPPNESDPDVETRYESVVVQNTLRRVLLDIPKAMKGPRPAVLLIGGIGCFSVDVASNPEDAYLRISRDLGRAGFITMRLEKSGVGDSQGPPCHDVDFKAESASYVVAFDALQRDRRVDPSRVYLLGHSIGTLIAPRLALERKVAGIIVAEAVGRDWFEYELQNLRRQLELAGDTSDVVDAKLQSKEYCMYRLLIAHDPESQIEADNPTCKLRNGIYPVAAPYMQQIAALNVIEPWTRISDPVLVVYGTSDYVVAPEDHRRIANVVNQKRPGLATLVPVDAMDHNLQIAATPAAFYESNAGGLKTRYQTEFSSAVLSWMCAREKCA